jgi:serine/threonine protein kinase/tetratricopeptide (TPR) repeat protein
VASLIGKQLGAYEIRSLLGAGGMGEVYRARDGVLQRDVALKVLSPNVVHDPGRVARFRREAQLLAALNHPNIATVFGFAEFEGVHGLVMELVPGESLAQRLKTGPVETSEALRLSGEIADALSAAHRRGIVHRDVKPANITVTPEGRVKVLDFGLATLRTELDPSESGASGDATWERLTREGQLVGTPMYMSPEQLQGQPVDARTDIWAFGCVTYEMLCGSPPFAGASLAEMIVAVLTTQPQWELLPATAPPGVRELLVRCLEKDRRQRLPDIVEARAGLRGDLQPAETRRGPEATTTVPSLAVLPFVNAAGDPQAEYLCDGITESLIARLAQLNELRVIARSSVFRHKGSAEDPRDIARALGVSAVVTGRVRQGGGSLVISVELVDVAKGWQLWGTQFKREPAAILAIEDEIANEVSETLRLKLAPEKRTLLARRRTENVEAYHLFLKGRFHWGKRTEDGLRKGLRYFRQAIEADPAYALAHAGLAEGYMPLAVWGHLAPRDAFPKARAAAERALEIDAELPEALTVLGSVNAWYEWDFGKGEALERRAVALDPGYPRARQTLAECLYVQARFSEAASEIERALELDPLSLHMNAAVVMHYNFGRRAEDAIAQGRRALELDPSFYPARYMLGLACQQAGRLKEAIAELEQARALSNNSTLVATGLAAALAEAGKHEQARSLLNELDAVAAQRYVPQSPVAAVHLHLGQADQAFACLERAREERCAWLVTALRADPRFDGLRGDTRFESLVRSVLPRDGDGSRITIGAP